MKAHARLAAMLMIACMCAKAGAATLRVTVTSTSGRSVFIDRGSAAGVVSGLRVRFFPPGGVPIDGVVTDVASNSSRVELILSVLPPPIGAAGELETPDQAPATRPSTQPTTIPAHPPWTRLDGTRTAAMPLLAPAFSVPASERSPTIHGRAFTDFQGMLDKGGDRDSRYGLARAGTAFTITNPFGQGGAFYFDGQYNFRNSDTTDGFNESQSDWILDRFSYAIGGEQYAPYRVEFGRFPSFYLPEIGLVDGVEGAMRFQSGLDIGAGVGLYPRDFPDQQEGDDLGFHIFIDYNDTGPSKFSGTVGYQKTWHEGAPDRDVILAHASMWLTKAWWLYGSARVDIYTPGDPFKSAGPALTSGWLQARYTPEPDRGLAILASHYTWADTKAMEFQLAPPDLIQNGRVDRIEVSAWKDIVKDLRPTARGSYFNDWQGDGYGGEFDMDWNNIRGMFDLHGDVFYNLGSSVEDYGFRTEFRYHQDVFNTFVGYELMEYNEVGTLQNIGYQMRNTVRGGVGLTAGSWYYSLTADYYFGDSDDAYTVGAYAEYRF